jgi:DNA-binding transcriptional LysR family regulator
MKVAATESFSAAARELNVTVPAVSKSISRLEAQLDVRLLERSTHQVNLTHEGRFFFETCVGSVDHMISTAEGLKGRSETSAGSIRLICSSGFGRKRVAPLLPEFIQRFPEITLDFQLSDRTVDFTDGLFDLAISSGWTPNTNLVVAKLAPMQLVICASPSYLSKKSTPRSIEELSDHKIIGYRDPISGKAHPWELHVEGELTRLQMMEQLTFNDLDVVTTATLAGAGLAQLPDYQVEPLISSGELIPVLPEMACTSEGHYLYHKRRGRMPVRTKLFADYLLACLSIRRVKAAN